MAMTTQCTEWVGINSKGIEVDHGRIDAHYIHNAEQQQAANTHKRCTSEA